MDLTLTESSRQGRAFATNLVAQDWSSEVYPRHEYPAGPGGAAVGVLTWGGDESLAGGFSSNRVKLVPYADLPPGQSFSLRVWMVDYTASTDEELVYDPVLLAELLCTTCEVSGPRPKPPAASSPYRLQPTERLCDSVEFTYGGPGVLGWRVSPGPGTNLPGFVAMETFGARLLQFDARSDVAGGLNCLWSKC